MAATAVAGNLGPAGRQHLSNELLVFVDEGSASIDQEPKLLWRQSVLSVFQGLKDHFTEVDDQLVVLRFVFFKCD